MWDQRGHYSSVGRRNQKGQFPAGHPLLPPLPEGHASAMCPSTPSGGVHFWVLMSSIWGTPVSLTSRVTFSPRQVSCLVTSGRRLSVKMWSCLCLLTLLMVLSKEHCFGVKQDLIWDDGVTQTGLAWLCSTRWPRLGGEHPIKTGHTLFIINMVENKFLDECKRKSAVLHVCMFVCVLVTSKNKEGCWESNKVIFAYRVLWLSYERTWMTRMTPLINM